ncbi:unnamed protein product [Dovyalis caffra]|uniref:Glycosyltransferase n=1 Tax=Dovyalis caffra TaxID=77055 RepID=A0AAV1RBK4_9ROSI|nr:unnamed protein product [Dovyalis caffra]
MESQPFQLHVAFFPYMAHGHIIPTVDMARSFARHGVKATIITTALNAPLFSRTIDRDIELGFKICILVMKFPSTEAGLPEGCENASSIKTLEMIPKFFNAVSLLQQPLEELLRECRPDCLVADMMFPWATKVSGKLDIPRLVFHGTSSFALCVSDCLKRYEPYKSIQSDLEPFPVPGLPDKIKLTKRQLPSYAKEHSELSKQMDEILQAELESYGVIMNSFHELEPAYSEHYKKVIGRKSWHIGPVSLCNRDIVDKVQRGGEASIDGNECLKWLAKKKSNSVLYICFGSMSKTDFSATQLFEIAKALAASGQNFVWVVKNEERTKGEVKEEWLPEGFEKQMDGNGLIIRGWAPQMLILDHEAIGGFMTHCGWNSTLEGITAGVPMVTWPLCAEQFYNEKLITDVLKIGVAVGAQEWSRHERKILVKKEEIANAIMQLMIGEEAEALRNRAKALKQMARKATEEEGSSYCDLNALLEELRAIKTTSY